MSRSYKNNQGETVTVDQEHLDMAVEIYEELVRESPSRRCSWPKHKRMMVAEGYSDSESSESYRQMIKFERMNRGTLPSIAKHAELVADSKIESIRNEIGNIYSAKQEASDSFRRLNKMRREMNRDLLFAEAIERGLKNVEFAPIDIKYSKDIFEEKTLIACLSDLHYGSEFEIEGREYNVDISRELVMKYAEKIIQIIQSEGITDVYVMQLGDLIEHATMRLTQSFNVQKTFSEQVIEATNLVIDFLRLIAEHAPVRYAGINGNHDRIFGSSGNDNLYGDGAVTLSNEIVKQYTRFGNGEIQYIESEPYHHIITVRNKSFLCVHGDKTGIKKESVLAEQSLLHGIEFDSILAGHYHSWLCKELGENKFIAIFGSIKGSDEYSLKKLNKSSSRSQGVVIVTDNDYEIRRIGL